MAGFQEEIQFEVLRRLHQTPQVSQRALAKDLGVGLGTINFCFQALVEKGLVKMHNFSKRKSNIFIFFSLAFVNWRIARELFRGS